MTVYEMMLKLNRTVDRLDNTYLAVEEEGAKKKKEGRGGGQSGGGAKTADTSAVHLRYNPRRPWNENVSHMLSELMRWSATRSGLDLGEDGYVDADALIERVNKALSAAGGVQLIANAEELAEVIESIQQTGDRAQDEQNNRFRVDRKYGKVFVRCHQGHAMENYEGWGGRIKLEKIFTRFQGADEYLYHSTDEKGFIGILQTGITCTKRMVHLWKSGAHKQGRKRSELVVRVSVAALKAHNIPIWQAGNGVLLIAQSVPLDCVSAEPPASETVKEIKSLGFKTLEAIPGKPTSREKERIDELKLDFFHDLCAAQMDRVLCVLCKCIRTNIEEMRSRKNSKLDRVEQYMTAFIYPKVRPNLDIKVQITHNAEEAVYLVMINGALDSDLMYCAKHYQFPRGCPVLWKPEQFVDFRGFYPKFDNDAKKQDSFDASLLDGAVKLSFFKKWSGFLLHVVAWKNEKGEYRWTVATKKNADMDNRFYEYGQELVSELIKRNGADFIMRLADEQLYLGGEAMHTKDEHGYITRKNALVVTCIGSGIYADLECVGPIANELQPLMQYKDVTGVAEFCREYGLDYDSAVTVVGDLREFVMDGLLQNRDMLTNSMVDKILMSGKFKGLSVLEGSADHSSIAGDVLEGFVFNLEYENQSKYTTKVKLPHYTWKTMFLREWLEKVRNKNAGEDVSPESLVGLQFEPTDVQPKIDDFVRKWCCTSGGKEHFQKLLQSAVALIRKGWAQELMRPGTENCTNRVHVKLGEHVESLSPEQLDSLVNEFYSSPDGTVSADTPPITIWVCLGPIGAGKSSLASLLGKFVEEKIGSSLVEVIDADQVVSKEYLLRLGSERNPVTKTWLWRAISRGKIPIISAGGGQFFQHITDDNALFSLKQDVRKIFRRKCELVVFFPERHDKSAGPATGELISLGPSEVDTFIQGLYPSAEQPNVQGSSPEAEHFKRLHPLSVALPKHLDSFYMGFYEVMSARIENGDWNAGQNGNETGEGAYHKWTLDVYKRSFGNRRFASLIAEAADRVFRLPYVATDPIGDFNARVVSCGTNLDLLGPLITRKETLPCSFNQVRALMANEKMEVKHVTLGYGSDLVISSEQWDQMDEIVQCEYEGKRFSMDLSKEDNASYTSTIIVDKLGEFPGHLMSDTNRYPHVTVSSGSFPPVSSEGIIHWLEAAALKPDHADFHLTDITKKNSFVFRRAGLKQDVMVPKVHPTTMEPIISKNGPLMIREKGNCSIGLDTVRYTCIGISAGVYSDWSAGGGSRRK
jgi:RNA:NAD 2'-phosphotransferase (TPT1/KptA family)